MIYSSLGFGTEETLILLCGWITGGIIASLIGEQTTRVIRLSEDLAIDILSQAHGSWIDGAVDP